MHTRQAAPFMARLRTVVSVGRCRWIPNSAFTGKDNCAWHFFVNPRPDAFIATHFYGRVASVKKAA